MTKKQMSLIRDLILFSKPQSEEYQKVYTFVVSQLYVELNKPYEKILKNIKEGRKNENN